jgi:hypothetical protein
MANFRKGLRGATVAALVLCSGCSWWNHHVRHEKPQAASAPAPATTSDEALAIGAAPATPESADMKSATTLATDFYEMRIKLGRSGLPDEGEMKAYRAFLCPSLSALMDAARVRQKVYIDEHPDDKPPLVEGDLFSSLFEGAEVVTPIGTTVEGESARVELSMRFGQGDQATKWKDTAVLAKDQGSWCLADVEYHGDWPFANKGKLSETLAGPF